MAVIQNNIPSYDMFDVKKRLVDLVNSYFQIENIDTYESGFLGYLIESLTALTSDTLFQNSMAYNEAFLTKAVLPSSVYNLANMLDYKPASAQPAEGALTIEIPLEPTNMYIKILAGSPANAGPIPYKIIYNYYIKKEAGNISVIQEDPKTGLITTLPYKIEIHNSKPTLVIDVVVMQIQVYVHDFTVINPQLYIFYEERVTGLTGFLYDVKVIVDNILYSEIESIYDATPTDKVYELMFDKASNILNIKFGNGIYGYQPISGATGKIVVTTTLGKEGNVAKNTITLGAHVVQDYVTGKPVACNSYNKAQIANGYNGETIEEIRRHTIESISAAKRLVTEKDYKSFQGITGLTDVEAAPYLVRRDVHSNEVSLYVVKFDDNGKPVPTSSIRVPFDLDKKIIPKGTIITDNDVTYIVPFNIELDDTKALPIGRYYYVITDLAIAPKLYTKINSDDVLMGVRQVEAQLNIDVDRPTSEDTVVFIANVFKFSDMVANNIHATLDLLNADGSPIGIDTMDMNFVSEYDNGTTCIFSTDPSSALQLSVFPDDTFKYKVTLYWGSKVYNTYEGDMKLKEYGKPVGSTVTGNTTSQQFDDDETDPSRYFHINSVSININSDSMRAEVVTDIIKLQTHDVSGNILSPDKINATFYIQTNNKSYPLSLQIVKENDYIFGSGYQISLQDLPVGEFNWKVDLYYENALYNTYFGSIKVLSNETRPVATHVSSEPNTIGYPNIELVKLSITSINVLFDDTLNAFKIKFDVSRLPDTVSDLISATIDIGDTLNIEVYNKGIGGENITHFESRSIQRDIIPLGEVPVTITLRYKGDIHSIYKQYIIFKADMSHILYSHIHRALDDGKLYAYNVPVIEQTFYNENKHFVDQMILSQLARLSQQFSNYKMLTDRVTVRFAKTYGNSYNMQLNQFNKKPTKIYPEYFYMKIPPRIKINASVSYNVTRPIPEITEEIRDAVYTFLQLKAGFHVSIYKSEIARFVHDVVDGVLYCTVFIPDLHVYDAHGNEVYLDDDVVYAFDLDDVTDVESIRVFTPEYIWFDKDKIDVTVTTVDVHQSR